MQQPNDTPRRSGFANAIGVILFALLGAFLGMGFGAVALTLVSSAASVVGMLAGMWLGLAGGIWFGFWVTGRTPRTRQPINPGRYPNRVISRR